MRVSLTDARTKLPKLIQAVENGEAATICRRGIPVVDIVRSPKGGEKKRTLGTLKGTIRIIDPDWWKPMTDRDADDFLAGRG